MTRNRVFVVGLYLILACLVGCGDDSAAIKGIEQLNQRVMDERGDKAIRMMANGGTVGSVYVLSNVDEAVPLIGRLKAVQEVYFQDGNFEDKHVDAIRGLSQLNSLIVSQTKITDAGVAKLAGSGIQALFLDGTAVTSDCLKSVASMKELTSLDLGNTNVQSDLTALGEHPNLAWVVLRDMDLSQLSDASIDALAAMPKLSRLTVTNTGITADAQSRIRAGHPGMLLEVSGEGGGEAAEPAGDEAAAEEG